MTLFDDRRGSRPMTPWQAWLSMLGIRDGPLSGDVAQDITSSIGGQLGLLNINATRSGDPGLEQRIITQVASYGRQLGRLIDAVDVLARQPRHGLSDADSRALDQLHELAERIAAVKEQKALDHVDRIVTEVQALSRHPKTNAEAIRRVREALPGDSAAFTVTGAINRLEVFKLGRPAEPPQAAPGSD
jgi:hypothetical protein